MKKKDWNKATEEEIEEELYMELNTIEKNTLVDLMASYMNKEEKIEFIKEWCNY